jgi:tetratricopeptide (TPR) repeat protein
MSSKRQKAVRRRPPPPAAPLAAPRRSPWLTAAIVAGLVLLTIAVFAQVRSHDFVDFDDGLYISDNANVRGGLTADNISWAFTTGRAANWHPLTWMSHQADVSMFGMDAGRHHLTNVFWHVLNVVLLFGFLRSLTGAVWKSALVAALFAVHPAHVESVAWISERKDVLSTFFLIAATWTWTSWIRKPSTGRWALAFITFALGLMSKPMLMTLPFVWLLLDMWPLGRAAVSMRQRVTEKLPFFGLAAVSLAVTLIVQQQGGAVTSLDRLTLSLRFANALTAYGAYLGMLVWPVKLTAFYPYSMSISAVSVAISAALLVGLSVGAWVTRRSLGFLLMGWLWFLGTLVPVIGLVQIGMQSHADRYTYVPYIGLFIALIWAAGEFAERSTPARAVVAATAVASVAALSFVAYAQTATWRTSEVLWSHAIAVTPDNAKAHNSLGAIYGNTGRVKEAEVQFKEALRLRPDLTEGLHIYPNLGRALAAQGKLSEAIPYLERAHRLKPDDAGLASELGFAYLGADRTTDAIAAWRVAVRLNPQLEQTWFVLGITLAAGGQIAEARQAFSEVVRINPGRQDAAMALQRLR